MMRLLVCNAKSYDLKALHEASSTGQRFYRVTDIHEAASEEEGAFFRAIGDMQSQFCDVDLWSSVEQSEKMCCEVARVALRAAAVLHCLVFLPALAFPYKVFSALRSPQHAAEVLEQAQAYPCLLDAWSSGFLAEHSTQESLCSGPAQQCLASLAVELMCNTYDAERGHSRNARHSRSRVHTHTMCLHDLSLHSSVSASKPWLDIEHAIAKETLQKQ